MITYSVIIPYRDKYELLKAAVGSVPEREDIQVVIVDNSDEPLPADLVPKKQVTRVDYTTSDPKKGAGHARNVGMTKAEGTYMLFLDADDYFTPDAFDEFDRYADKRNDITFFSATSIRLGTGERSRRHMNISRCIGQYMEQGDEDGVRYRYVTPYCKMFLTSFVRESQIQFDELPVSNDMMFSIRTGHNARTIGVSKSVAYVITEGQSNTSLTRTRTASNQFTRYTVAIEQYKFMEAIGRKDLRFHLLSFVLHSLTGFGPKEFVKYIRYAISQKVNIFLR